MPEQLEQSIHCPYCGESITVLIDSSVDQQEYIEDCQVCCRPIVFNVAVNYQGDININVSSEDE